MSDDILILRERISGPDLRRLVAVPFGHMVKFVADLDRRVIAIGGQMHADAEHLLLDDGSQQRHLWGGNYLPGRGRDRCVEYTSFINIRPAQGNAAMEVGDPETRTAIRSLVFDLVGEGEALGDGTA